MSRNYSEQLFSIKTFGGIDANTDDVLIRSFENHSAYQAASSFAKTIITGRKGSGKSAIYRKIVSYTAWDHFSLGFTFSDYPWDYHATQKQSGVPREECYRESWKYFIGLAFAKVLLEHSGAVRPGREGSAAYYDDIRHFVKDSYGTAKPNLASLFTPGTKIRLSGHLYLFGAGAHAEPIDISDLPKFYSEINRNITDSIVRCSK